MLLNQHQFTTILVRFRNTEFDYVIGSGEHQVKTLDFFPLLIGIIPWFEFLQMIRWLLEVASPSKMDITLSSEPGHQSVLG
jgi:hypothetical protein